jgi:hypothetical protein
MKKMLLMAGVLAMAACGEKKAEAPAAETTGEMAPAAAPMDSAAMPADTGMMHSDSVMARDSAK